MSIEQIIQDENKYMMHTFGRYKVAIESGKGARAYDIDGREYIDFTAGIGVNALGYCDEGWQNAVTAQLKKVQHISNLYYSPAQVECAKLLCQSTGLDKVFFANSGAEVNECAIKLARKYSFDKYGQGRNEIISLKNSFHGRTMTTLSATGQEVFHQFFYPFDECFVFAEANDIESVSSLVSDKTCAVMLELVQGEGGVMPLDKEFVKAVEKLCSDNDLVFIIDEVQTGMGRTGNLFCFQSYGVKPDVITSSKALGGGLPLGACLCNERLSEVLTPGTNGSTFGGNPVACAGAIEMLNRINNEEFLSEVKKKGEYIAQKLIALDEVEQVRGMGMMIGIVLKKDNAKEVASRCVQNGLLVLTAKNLIRLLPPLNIPYEDIDKGIEIFKKSL